MINNHARTRIDTMICANAQGYSRDGEVLVTPIGVLPRVAASLAMMSTNPDIMMTDSESWMLSSPNPIDRAPDFRPAVESWMGLSRVFDNLWGGKRHITCTPTQIDRYGQANISMIGDDHEKPTVQMLGVRGFPGNSICHANTFLIPKHSRKVFVEGECDIVCTIGYNPERLPRGYDFSDIDLRTIITDLCVMDFGGTNRVIRLLSLHNGVTLDEVRDNTGFALDLPSAIPTTPAPTDAQMQLIQRFDPNERRYS